LVIMTKTPHNVPVEDGVDFTPVVEQGLAAAGLGMTEADCPYSIGEFRDAWLAGLNATEDAPQEVPPTLVN
jgi:ribosome modulation factor